MARLLTDADGSPVAIENPHGSSPVVLVCEHASRRLPQDMGNLGLGPEALESHISWDPGALAVSLRMVEQLDATLFYQRFSRLVYDCNRPPEAEAAMPAVSEIYDIPGNAGLSAEQRLARTQAIYDPFRNGLADLIAARAAAGQPTVLVTMHSFTPVYHGKPRSVEVGILHDTDARLADAMLAAAAGAAFDTRRNEPYGPIDGVTHTLIEHGLKNGLLNAMIEIRNDLVSDDVGQKVMADYLVGLLGQGLASLPK
ncbi:N-formylglutamate amidohydrolase [Pararhizobium antarcticum]|uniref:N-formylglutamate amidohydrolase n=1 Tax=Pararhizobium antarcticum TaxID=1798805 RepID=A0A657LQX7_9HYPH|nr:N-formylglutamate amidohydrolase [Pararhizobium antarcticum]OJF95637.1 N-formylglutamate amidohydrolase [Pararhizobium antarcticum]OJG00299.1 N-formylglutamate amidohydrolase [Rhizobium sp. 58]